MSERAATGVHGLDSILGGGLPRHRIYLVEGDPGAGKTTLAMQFLLEGVRQGEPVLYITLSETESEIRMIADSHGWSLDGVSLFELSALEQQMKLEAENTIFHPSEVELTETTRALLRHVDKVRPKRVVFDSLSELRLLAQNPLRYRREVLNLKQYFTNTNATVMLLDDRTSESGDMQLQSLAHGVLSLQQMSPEYGGDRRRLRVAKLRGLRFVGGYHDFTICTGGIELYPRLVAAEHHVAFEKRTLSSGLAGLDAMLGGGIDRGTSTLVMGPAGSGKSAVAQQYAVAAARRGEKVAIFSFDELRGIAIARADALGMRMSEHVESGAIIVQQVDPAEMSPGELTQRARDLVETGGVTFLVIDSVNGYLHAMPAERFLYIQMHELLAYLGQSGATTMILMVQQGLVGEVTSPVDVSYLADTVILLRYFEALGRVRKAASVIKKRSGPHEDTIREITIGTDGIKFGAPLSEFRGVLTSVPEYHGSTERLEGK
jgi:circadian clock protein KaiC